MDNLDQLTVEKKRLENFGKLSTAIEIHVIPGKDLALVECRAYRGTISPLLKAAFPHAGKDTLSSLTTHTTLHPAVEFMEKLADGLLYDEIVNDSIRLAEMKSLGIGMICVAYTEDGKWDSNSLFVLVPLSDMKKISKLLEVPHIERGTTEFDVEYAMRLYRRLFWRKQIWNYRLVELVKPKDVETDILNRSITIDTNLDIKDIESIVYELASLGFSDIHLKSNQTDKIEELKTLIKGKLTYVEFAAGGRPIRTKVFISITDGKKNENIDNIAWNERPRYKRSGALER